MNPDTVRNLVLCGFMGSGKTTVGRLAAKRTGMRFVDCDLYIEQEAGMTVSEIFARFGEAEFRRMEREACRTLAGEKGLVIATGGGALTFPENVRALAASGLIVFLDAAPETVLRRLARDTSRPLLQGADRKEKVRGLLGVRRPLYAAAAHVMVNGDKSAEETAEEIIRIYESALKR